MASQFQPKVNTGSLLLLTLEISKYARQRKMGTLCRSPKAKEPVNQLENHNSPEIRAQSRALMEDDQWLTLNEE